jgi:uncharacterized membrane protein
LSAQPVEFQRGAIHPIECLSEGWQLVKNDFWLMVGICAVGIFVGSVAPLGLLLGPLMCGIHMCMFALQRGEKPSFNLLFKGFDFFVPSLIATLVQVIPMMILIVPAYIVFFVFVIGASAAAGSQRGGEDAIPAIFFIGFALFFVFIFVVAITIGTLFKFTYQLVADRGLSGFDACKWSAKAVFGNLGGAIGLVLLTALLGLAGVVLCYVGALLVLPISFAAIDVAYRRVFPPPIGRPATPYAPPPQYPNYGEHYPPMQ